MAKIIKPAEAASLIADEALIGCTTNCLGGLAEEILAAIGDRYLQEGHPKNITFASASGIGNKAEGRGLDHLAHEGLTKRLICGHLALSPRMSSYASNGKVEAYMLPQGIITNLYRAAARKTPGVLSRVGLETFVDPRLQGAKVNASTTEDYIKVVEVEGREYLHYQSINVDVAIVRATTADTEGNLGVEQEASLLAGLPIATAAKNNGGIVIAQVKNIDEANALKPKDVYIPGALVDYVVVNENPDYHYQTMGTEYNPAFSGEERIAVDEIPPMELNARKIIARRAAMELTPASIINLGIGMPTGVASVAAEEGVFNEFTSTLELGAFGGVPAEGKDFGAAYNASALIPHDSMFDFYDGGGLDTAFLGSAEFDKHGNVNVSQFGSTVTGPGGFINISQSSKQVVFMGTFTVGGKAEAKNNELVITNQGKLKKIVDEVQQVTFSGNFASENNIPTMFITERGVFDIVDGNLRLIEIAPGVDLQRDILDWMEFRPIIADELKTMNPDIFAEEWGGLKEIIDRKKYTAEGVK